MKVQEKNIRLKANYIKIIEAWDQSALCLLDQQTDIFKKNKDKSKFVPEGVEGRVEYKGSLSKIIYQLKGGLQSSMGYIGAKNLKQLSKNAKFIKITKAGFYESMVHSVEMTQKTINYKL